MARSDWSVFWFVTSKCLTTPYTLTPHTDRNPVALQIHPKPSKNQNPFQNFKLSPPISQTLHYI
ncbi:hypothetical protein Hanom_Chr06g00571081 [Helianthus anomalus]